MQIVGRKFSAAQIAGYVDLVVPSAAWHGRFVTLHNTGAPTLAQRPAGLTEQHIENLRSYYEGKGWHAGPHMFVDDHGVWIFSPLSAPGVHSPSWNDEAWGVEMLGDYETEVFDSGRGAAVRDNAVAAIAALCQAARIDSHTLRLHREDPATTHRDCPGRNVDKADMISRIHAAIAGA